jgi:hypothetical protein
MTYVRVSNLHSVCESWEGFPACRVRSLLLYMLLLTRRETKGNVIGLCHEVVGSSGGRKEGRNVNNPIYLRIGGTLSS